MSNTRCRKCSTISATQQSLVTHHAQSERTHQETNLGPALTRFDSLSFKNFLIRANKYYAENPLYGHIFTIGPPHVEALSQKLYDSWFRKEVNRVAAGNSMGGYRICHICRHEFKETDVKFRPKRCLDHHVFCVTCRLEYAGRLSRSPDECLFGGIYGSSCSLGPVHLATDDCRPLGAWLTSHNPVIDRLRWAWSSQTAYQRGAAFVLTKLRSNNDVASRSTMPRQQLGYARETKPSTCLICNTAEDAYGLTCGHFYCEPCAVADLTLWDCLQTQQCPLDQCYGRRVLPPVVSESLASPTSIADRDTDEYAVCPICFGDREDGSTTKQIRLYGAQSKPIRLGCGHALCAPCFGKLRSLAQAKWDNRSRDSAPLADYFTCPTCRVPITTDSRRNTPSRVTVIRFEDKSGLVVEAAGVRQPAHQLKANTNVIDLTDTSIDLTLSGCPKDVADVCDDNRLIATLAVAALPINQLRQYGSGGWGYEFHSLFWSAPYYQFTVPWCVEALKDLTVFYRVHFGPMILENRPLLMCGHFSAKPLCCFDKYKSEFDAHTSFLELSDPLLKVLFLEGIPQLSITFRTLLSPQVVDPDITFAAMVEHGRHALASDPNSYLSARQLLHPGSAGSPTNKRHRTSD